MSRVCIAVLTLAASCLANVALAQTAAETVLPAAATKNAKLSLASIFSDHMVLQRDMKLPIWGEAAPGAKVVVELAGKSQEATADDQGQWKLTVGPLKTSPTPLEMTVSAGDDKLHLTDILVGDVWICSGQSNMEWPMSATKDAETEIAIADWPEIRIIDVPNVTGEKPAESFESHGWQPCNPANITQFSAVGYFFARDLHKHLGIPIGLIGCNWGGTPMEAWTSREALASSKTFAGLGKELPPAASPEEAEKRKRDPHRPSSLFNGMIAPVVPYGIRGAIWYQGESNAARHAQYAELSKLMIADWRNRWGQGEFPFLLVQLAAFEPGGDAWPYLREAQAQTLEAANTGMAVAIDIGDRNDIHPRNKQDVGARLALAARKVAYGEDVVHSGPTYREMKAEDGAIRLSFDNAGGGLKIKEGDALKGFAIAGDDGQFVPAEAKIDGSQVVVSSPQVAQPKHVRYNWAAFPDGNLANAENLPAVPFRTDDLPAPK